MLLFIVMEGCEGNNAGNLKTNPSSTALVQESPVTPSPTVNITTFHITDIAMTDESSGWSLNRNPDPDQSITPNTILHTSNGWRTWNDVMPKEALSNANSINHLVGWQFSGTWGWLVIGNKFYETEDSGTHWVSTTLSVSPVDAHVNFVNHQDGWILAITGKGAGSQEGQLLRTIDGGKIWKSTSLPRDVQNLRPDNITFISVNKGFVTGLNGNLTGRALLGVTNDGGVTWNSLAISLPSSFSSSFGSSLFLRFFDTQHGVMQVLLQPDQKSLFYSSTNGGGTWKLQGTPQPFVTSSFVSLDNGWGVDANGMMFATSNGGKHWSKLEIIPTITTIQFTSEKNGWGVSNDGGLMETKNGGREWSKVGP
jgi:photosystem II stability/assembly factor-like uncharacterized protein